MAGKRRGKKETFTIMQMNNNTNHSTVHAIALNSPDYVTVFFAYATWRTSGSQLVINCSIDMIIYAFAKCTFIMKLFFFRFLLILLPQHTFTASRHESYSKVAICAPHSPINTVLRHNNCMQNYLTSVMSALQYHLYSCC